MGASLERAHATGYQAERDRKGHRGWSWGPTGQQGEPDASQARSTALAGLLLPRERRAVHAHQQRGLLVLALGRMLLRSHVVYLEVALSGRLPAAGWRRRRVLTPSRAGAFRPVPCKRG